MYRLKTHGELLADGWLHGTDGFYRHPDLHTPINPEMMRPDRLPSQKRIEEVVLHPDGEDGIVVHEGNHSWYWTPSMFTWDENAQAPGRRGVSKPGENIEAGGCICFMKKHRFSGHMRYCPAYS